MTDALVPALQMDVFEDQVFSIFGAIRDAGFDGHIEGPEWAKLDSGKEAARITIHGVNTASLMGWNVEYFLIREIDDDTVSVFVRPFGAEYRHVSPKLNHFQLYEVMIYETLRAINTFAPPLSLYLDMCDGRIEIPSNVAIFPPEKTFLEPPK